MFAFLRTFVVLLALMITTSPALRAEEAVKPFGFYTTQALATTLGKLGHETTVTDDVILLKVKREKATITVIVALDKENVLLVVKLAGPFKDPAALPAKDLKALLNENDAISPIFFAVNASGHLTLNRYVDNREREAAAWRTLIEDVASIAVRTLPTWYSDAIKAQEVTEPPAPASGAPAGASPSAASPAAPSPAIASPVASPSPGK